MHPSWSWSSVPFAVTWPAQSPYRDPISAEELGCRFFPSAQVVGQYTCPAPWDAKQRVTNGLIMLSGKLYPVQARSMTWTAKGYEIPGHLPGTFLLKDFVLATTASPAVHHVRFPSDCVILFSPDLLCLYGDGVVEDYRAWSALLAESLCEEEKRAVAAIHRHRAAAGLGGGATSERSRAGGSRASPARRQREWRIDFRAGSGHRSQKILTRKPRRLSWPSWTKQSSHASYARTGIARAVRGGHRGPVTRCGR